MRYFIYLECLILKLISNYELFSFLNNKITNPKYYFLKFKIVSKQIVNNEKEFVWSSWLAETRFISFNRKYITEQVSFPSYLSPAQIIVFGSNPFLNLESPLYALTQSDSGWKRIIAFKRTSLTSSSEINIII